MLTTDTLEVASRRLAKVMRDLGWTLHEAPLSFAEERSRNPVIRPSLDSAPGRALTTKQTVQVADVRDEPAHPDLPAGSTGAQLAKLAGARTFLAVPMLKDDKLIGAIVIYRQEVRPFTDNAVRICRTHFGVLLLFEGGAYARGCYEKCSACICGNAPT